VVTNTDLPFELFTPQKSI